MLQKSNEMFVLKWLVQVCRPDMTTKLSVYQAFETDVDNFSEIRAGEDLKTTATNRNWHHICLRHQCTFGIDEAFVYLNAPTYNN